MAWLGIPKSSAISTSTWFGAGEASGHLDLVLERLARFMEKAQRLRGKLMAAMVYPIVVMTLAFSILGFLMVFVVPRFEAIYANFLGGASLPPLTQAILGPVPVRKGSHPHYPDNGFSSHCGNKAVGSR